MGKGWSGEPPVTGTCNIIQYQTHNWVLQGTGHDLFREIKIGEIAYCSTPSKIKLSCLGELYYHKILPLLLPAVILLKLAIYSQGQQKKFNYSAPIRDIELKFWG